MRRNRKQKKCNATTMRGIAKGYSVKISNNYLTNGFITTGIENKST